MLYLIVETLATLLLLLAGSATLGWLLHALLSPTPIAAPMPVRAHPLRRGRRYRQLPR